MARSSVSTGVPGRRTPSVTHDHLDALGDTNHPDALDDADYADALGDTDYADALDVTNYR